MRWATIRVQDGFECRFMNSTDPASLQNLHDIVMPGVVSWWPVASGWYVLSSLVLITVAWFGYSSLKDWVNNRYRRTALNELRLLATGICNEGEHDSSLRQIPVLLKRAALTAYPRRQVASLSGKNWYDFLNSKVKEPVFTESVIAVLDLVSYSKGDLETLDPGASKALLNASKYWLQNHQVVATPERSVAR